MKAERRQDDKGPQHQFEEVPSVYQYLLDIGHYWELYAEFILLNPHNNPIREEFYSHYKDLKNELQNIKSQCHGNTATNFYNQDSPRLALSQSLCF